MRGVVDCLKQELSGDVPHCAQAAPAGVGGRGLSPPAPPHAIVESGLKGPLGGARTHAIAHARRYYSCNYYLVSSPAFQNAFHRLSSASETAEFRSSSGRADISHSHSCTAA